MARFGGRFQKADGEQGQPTQADHDREPLEQPCEIHQAFGLPEARAGEDERAPEDDAGNYRVGCPYALAPRCKTPTEHEARGR